MEKFRNKFKKFGGSHIPDIIEYLKEYIEKEPGVTISVGCDSIQKMRKTIYAITIMMYSGDIRNGAHVVFFRERIPKVKETQERLYKESLWCLDVANFLNDSLQPFYKRKDLCDYEQKRYKYHLLRCDGEFSHVPPQQESNIISNLTLTSNDQVESKLVDIHLDFNPFEGTQHKRGVSRNRSHLAYKSYVGWLRGLGFRVWAKPESPASSSAADLLLKD